MFNEIEFDAFSGNSSKKLELLAPRRTVLLSEPTIRWEQVPNASYYVVSLMNGSETCWQKKVSETEIVYPGTPPLKPGILYSLAIKSDNNFLSASALDTQQKFQLLDPISVHEVECRTKQIRELGLAPEVEAFVLINLYLRYSLNAEAIKTLEELLVDGTQTFVVYRTLSELYQYVGLNVLSEAHSKTASELESAIEATIIELLEQEVIKVLEQQLATNISTKQEANLLEQKITTEAVIVETQQFLFCAVGQPCTTSAGQPGTWTYAPRSGCYCRPQSG